MPESTYSIAYLAARAYMEANGMNADEAKQFRCDEGTADIVTRSGDSAVLMTVSAKRRRGDAKPPEYSEARLKRIAMCYVAQNPDVNGLRFDVLEALVGANATVTVNALDGAYSWER